MTCGICFDTHARGEMRAAECGHAYCVGCWQGYLASAVADGPSCLRLRCPMPDCGVLVRAWVRVGVGVRVRSKARVGVGVQVRVPHPNPDPKIEP